MSYNKKIEILENNISELDKQLKIISAKYEENADTTLSITKLIADDLSTLIDEKTKKVSQDYENKFNEITGKLKSSVIIKKKQISLRLEGLRTQSDIIRKISPPISDILDPKIDELERLELELTQNWESWLEANPKQTGDENDKMQDNIEKKTLAINNIIFIARTCIKDTLDKIQN